MWDFLAGLIGDLLVRLWPDKRKNARDSKDASKDAEQDTKGAGQDTETPTDD